MLNPFVLKKYISFIILIVLPANILMLGQSMFGILPAMGIFAVMSVVCIFVANMFLKNPFTDLIEGKGLLIVPIDSTGICQPLLVGMNSKTNMLKTNNNRIGEVSDYFDRETAFSLATPKKSEKISVKINKDGVEITDTSGEETVTKTLSFNEFADYKFGMMQYPLLFWNKELKSFLTKTQVSNFEKETLATHPIYRLNMMSSDMQKDVRDLSRGIVDLALKPEKESLFKNPVFIIILIIIMVVVFGALILPKILPALSGGFAGLMP